jgi:hypothetical protein
MTPRVPAHVPRAHEPQIGLVDEGGRLEGKPGGGVGLLGHPSRGELPKFFVDQREQLIRRARVTACGRVQQQGDLVLGGFVRQTQRIPPAVLFVDPPVMFR